MSHNKAPKRLRRDREKPVLDNIAPKKLKYWVEEKSSENNAPQIKYDVFVSFRGEDIRHTLLSHLIAAFERKKICAFIDAELKRGHEIGPSLVQAIEQSDILLIIFSPHYASSHWCLEELEKILDCRDKYGRTVIPVFYNVQPTDVRHQLGSYETAFVEHELNYQNKVQIWKDVLKQSADLSGIDSSKFPYDFELVEEIANVVLKELVKPLVSAKELVGIGEKIATIESWIKKYSKGTSLIGIWGMGGIGKTTLAEEVFNKLHSEYEACYFLAHEREESNKHGIISLKEKIFSGLLGCEVKIYTQNSLPGHIARRISRMKVLIVLDDVNDSDHIKNLLGDLGNFESGSTIIVTTRNEQVLKTNKVDAIYQLTKLSFIEALELFDLLVNRNDNQREYNEVSERVVHYAQGIPLVLKVLAGHLRGNKKEVWESELDKLKKMPHKEVYDVMTWSFYDLDRKQQQIFLDLACFFLRSQSEINVGDLKFLLKDSERDNSVVADLERLKEKSVITVSKDNFVSMHDSLQEMAWEIVRRESIEDPGRRSRLWDPDDIYVALKSDKVTETIRSIRIDLPTIKDLNLIPHMFAKMRRLQFLEISEDYEYDCSNQLHILAKGLQFLATELRFIAWLGCPLKSLPENFSAQKLVILKLPDSNMETLWDGVKNLVNLIEVDLSGSEKLKELPDLSKATNLEVLYLGGCSALICVHPSIFPLAKLEKLELWGCVSLTTLTSNRHLGSLSFLDLDYCKNLREFSVISENMEELRLERTKVKALPSSFEIQSKLKSLDLAGSDIERLPSSFTNLTQLQCLEVSETSLQVITELPTFLKTLNATWCTSLLTLPQLPQSLQKLDVTGCKSLLTLPELPPFLVTLKTRLCTSLQILPKLPLYLKTLDVRDLNTLQTLPHLPQSLQNLNVSRTSVQTLPELPLSLKTLSAEYCYSLQILPDIPQSLEILDVSFCKSLQTVPKLPLSLKNLVVRHLSLVRSLPNLPQSLQTLDTEFCISLQTLPELPQSLRTLNVVFCTSLQTLPELPPFLECLNAQYCYSLQILPKLPLSLKTLDVTHLSSLQTLPCLPQSLQTLNAELCTSLQILPELPLSLEILNAKSCSSLRTLSKLPQSLTTLDITGCESLQILPDIPQSIETLDVSFCKSLQILPKLPLSLKTLVVGHLSSLQTLPDLPQSLQTLNTKFCSSLLTLPKLPHSLKTLEVPGCKSLQTLPDLPQSLEAINVRTCTSLQSLPNLPQSLENLNVESCSSLQTFPVLSPSLKILIAQSCYSLRILPKLSLSLSTLNVIGCKSLQTLPELPPSLETLSVRLCTSLKTLPQLPPSLKNLNAQFCTSLLTLPEISPSLETLDVKSCIKLHTLPELPRFLKTLNAINCRLLKTALLFPSTTAEQLMEDRKHVLFGNCSNLDEHSLEAIGLNAQINMINFVNRHIPTPNHAHFENYYEYLKSHDPYEAEAVYVYPGSIVPEWLEYKTMKDYIIIDLSSAALPLFFAFIFCFVLGECRDLSYTFDSYKFNITISDGHGDDEGNEEDRGMMYMGEHLEDTIESDTVCMKYDRRCSEFLNCRAKNQARFKIKVTPKSQDVVLKGFGVSPISTSAYNSFIQQMKLRDSMFQFR